MNYENNNSLKPTSYWKYFLKSLVVLLILCIVLGLMWGFVYSSDAKLKRNVLIIFGVVAICLYIAFWIYIIIHETNIRKSLNSKNSEENSLKDKRLAILSAHKAQAKALGVKLTKQEIEDIKTGKYDNEV